MRTKLGAAMLATALAVMATAAPASAARPTITTSPFSQTIVDDQSCSFPNLQVFTGTVRSIAYADGRLKLFFRLQGHITANGRSLTDRDHYSVTVSPTGSATIVGTVIHIVLPGGGVVNDAGRIVIGADGSLIGFTGRQDQLTGNLGAFCAALS